MQYFPNVNVGSYTDYDKLFEFYEVRNFDKNISIKEVISKFVMDRVFYDDNLKNPIPKFPKNIIKKVGHDRFKADLEDWLYITIKSKDLKDISYGYNSDMYCNVCKYKCNDDLIIYNTFISNQILNFIYDNFENNICFYSVDLFNSYIDEFDLDTIDFNWGCRIKTYFFCNDKNCYFLSLYIAVD